MKRRSATQTVVGRNAQVDLCPADGGMVVSVGAMSIWLERAAAEDLVETLEMALLIARGDGKLRSASAGEAPRAARRAEAGS
jgi:hypothetical protein